MRRIGGQQVQASTARQPRSQAQRQRRTWFSDTTLAPKSTSQCWNRQSRAR
jgi:hypothetical protein